MAAMFVNGLDQNGMSKPYRGPSIDASKFQSIWPSCLRGDFFKSANQKQELPVAVMFVNGWEQNVQSL